MKTSSKRLIVSGVFLAFIQHTIFQTRSLLRRGIFENFSLTTINTNATLPSLNPFENVLAVWDDYKSKHSIDVLRNETPKVMSSSMNNTRKFAVGYYSCPLQAGNRLHHFINSLLWAVITNRTLLWKYYDEKTCRTVGRLYSQRICEAANEESDCQRILKRAEWLPAADEWMDVYRLAEPVHLSYWTTHQTSGRHKHKFWYDGAEKDAGIADSTPLDLVDFPQMLGQDSYYELHYDLDRQNLLNTTQARERAKLLFSAGADYVYGLLISTLFSFQPCVSVPVIIPEWKNSSKTMTSSKPDIGISVVVHSRHSKVSDNGSSIARETKCLDKILSNYTEESCQVMLLSDRPLTLRNMAAHIAAVYPRCQVMLAPHENGTSFSIEHGPFSGMGFFQDLAMVANQTRSLSAGRSAFVGTKRRSSSQLIREIMSYELNKPTTRTGHSTGSAPRKLATCYLEDTTSSHNMASRIQQ